MSDLTDRLRELQIMNDDNPQIFDTIAEAADHIERLEAAMETLADMMSDMDMSHSEHVKLKEIMASLSETKAPRSG